MPERPPQGGMGRQVLGAQPACREADCDKPRSHSTHRRVLRMRQQVQSAMYQIHRQMWIRTHAGSHGMTPTLFPFPLLNQVIQR